MFPVRLELHFKPCADEPTAPTSETYSVVCTELAQSIMPEPSLSTLCGNVLMSAHCSLSPSELFKAPVENYTAAQC